MSGVVSVGVGEERCGKCEKVWGGECGETCQVSVGERCWVSVEAWEKMSGECGGSGERCRRVCVLPPTLLHTPHIPTHFPIPLPHFSISSIFPPYLT